MKPHPPLNAINLMSDDERSFLSNSILSVTTDRDSRGTRILESIAQRMTYINTYIYRVFVCSGIHKFPVIGVIFLRRYKCVYVALGIGKLMSVEKIEIPSAYN